MTVPVSLTLTDQSGNTLVIPFLRYQKEKQHIILSFNTLVYNGSTATIATTILKYQWEKNKKGVYTMFSSSVTTGATTTETHYNSKENTTVIMIKRRKSDENDIDEEDGDNQSVKTTLQGIIIPSITTNKGSIAVVY